MKETMRASLAARYDLHSNLWLRKGEPEAFAYSDGDETENRIHDIIAAAGDVSLFSHELKAAQTDWASRYHLSATRANLLRPLASILSGSTMEIGSGCGAISRFLGELGGDVVGIEGSPRRAAIAASRCRDLPNVNIVNEVFDDLVIDEKFDAVTLIGVLEYSSIFGKGTNPALTWLKKAYESLNDGGHLVIAIENQLGLKYLAGMPEDHLAKAMFGINDLYGEGTATTYGRVELSGLLAEAGFGSVEVALPFPDYKLPTSVLLPRSYDSTYPSFDASAFARQSVAADAQLIHAPLFSLGQAWGVVGRNHLLPDLANSFLFVARKGTVPAAWATSGAIAHHFSTERLSPYCKQVDFVPTEAGINVRKTRLAPDTHSEQMRPISLVIADEPYIPGANHCDRFERIVSAQGWGITEVAEWLGEWQEALDELLLTHGVRGPHHVHSMLPDWAIDALPRNLMRSASGAWHFIDLEWEWKAGVEYGYLAYRAITVAMASLAAIAAPALKRHRFIREVMLDVLAARGMSISSADIERYVELDGVLRKLAFGVSADFTSRDFGAFEVAVMPDVTSLVIDAASEARASAFSDLTEAGRVVEESALESLVLLRERENAELAAELGSLRAELATATCERDAQQRRSCELSDEIDALRHDIAFVHHAHAATQHSYVELQSHLASVLSSKSWRLMAPLRIARRSLKPGGLRIEAGRAARAAFRAMPGNHEGKRRLKESILNIIEHFRSGRSRVGEPEAEEATSSLPAESVQARVVSTPAADEYVSIAASPVRPWEIDVRLIAFYLPQFHPIAENDAWWGRGFTEWTNVTKARPQYPGHHQPQLPGELGFYDLRLIDVMRQQVDLAKLYGIAGFCFHYYWFGGRRLLERPVNQFLESDIDFPFCICWANENWTRRWDGMDGEILIGQAHSEADDLAFIEALIPLLRDKRYIHVNGKPLIVVYRPSVLPDAAATVGRWRKYCREAGVGEIFMGMVQFDVDDPRTYGFDAAIEFPPHKLARNLPAINDEIDGLASDFAGTVIDYEAICDRAAEVEDEGFNLFRGVFPSWDNEARKPGRGYLFHGATPERYGRWLRQGLDFARRHPVEGEKIVFVNAWNEWAEGAHLEPDRRYGYAFLQATRDALVSAHGDLGPSRRLILVTHDAHPHGAQYLTLNIARELREVFHVQLDIVCLGEGPLIEKFCRFGDVHLLAGLPQDGAEAKELVDRLAAKASHAVVNSTVSGLFAGAMADAGIEIATLVHEMPGVIRQYHVEEHARVIAAVSRRVLFPSEVVRDGFLQFAQVPDTASEIRPQGLFTRSPWRGMRDRAIPRANLREKLGIASSDQVVLSVGYADLRKGADLFVEAALQILASRNDVQFVWVGHADDNLLASLTPKISDAGFSHNFHFVGMDFNTADYYAGADLYVLASREDPFPSVVLEALSVGLPVVAFASSGGARDVLSRGCGLLVHEQTSGSLASTVANVLLDGKLLKRLGDVGMHLVATEFSFRRYVFTLLDACGLPVPKVSAVVPNYNYAHLLGERLRSIDAQTLPVYELIVLDDGSTDGSIDALDRLRPTLDTEFVVVANTINSGSVFRQWMRGAQLAQGEYLWIAEADDACEPRFLQEVLPVMISDPGVVLSFSQSRQIDDGGHVIADDYLGYTNDVDGHRWRADYVNDGADEIATALSIKNTIPNVSAVVFRTTAVRQVLEQEIEDIASFRIAGDWLTYMLVASGGRVAFTAKALNHHRRHAASITLGSDQLPHLQEILRVQEIARSRFDVPVGQAERAWQYAEGLYQQFGMASPASPTLGARPDLAHFRP